MLKNVVLKTRFRGAVLHGLYNEMIKKPPSDYKIRVPETWNGVLLVYAHGYSANFGGADAAPGGTPMEDFLLSLGFAVAGSSYQADGWAVKEGLQDTASLTNFFKGKVGNPDKVILWGFSMGSVIAFESAERFPGIYDGVIAGCDTGISWPSGPSANNASSRAMYGLFGELDFTKNMDF